MQRLSAASTEECQRRCKTIRSNQNLPTPECDAGNAIDVAASFSIRDRQCSAGFKILSGGEALSPRLANRLLERATSAWNLYGPTETTIWSTMAKVTPNESASSNRPAGGEHADLYSRCFVAGVAGQGSLARSTSAATDSPRGYFNRPELTAENSFKIRSATILDSTPLSHRRPGEVSS